MFGFSILSPLFNNVIETKFVKNVYHTVTLQPRLTGGGVSPAAPVSGRYIYVGVDDTNGFSCYCRQTGPLEVVKSEIIGGCNMKKYKTHVPHRLIFFNDNETRSHEDITSQIIKSVIGSAKIILSKVHINREDILKTEAPTGQFKFKAKTFYIAIDFFVVLDLQTDNCEEEIRCEEIENPYCGPTE